MVQIEHREFRVVTYARVSTPRQAKEGQSIETQPESLKRYTEAHGWLVVGELSDPG
jgi:DNA invertase Pin-like site-specific DNA recombinase